MTLAVAGIAREDIEISVERDSLRIVGTIAADEKDYIYRGIANRSFQREFKLGEYIEVASADLSNGLLEIELRRVVPEDQKKKTILIGNK